jgi:hypothetical protein
MLHLDAEIERLTYHIGLIRKSCLTSLSELFECKKHAQKRKSETNEHILLIEPFPAIWA